MILFALGEVPAFIATVAFWIVLIVGSIINAFFAVPFGLWIAFRLSGERTKRSRLVWGVVATLFFFVLLWIIEIASVLYVFDLPKAWGG